MRQILSNLLHIYVIFMMSIFVLGCIFAASGMFDHWEERYLIKRRQRRIKRGVFNNTGTNITPWYSARPDLSTISFNGSTFHNLP